MRFTMKRIYYNLAAVMAAICLISLGIPDISWAVKARSPKVEPNASNSVKLRNPMTRTVTLKKNTDVDIPEYHIRLKYTGLEKDDQGQETAILNINFMNRDGFDGVMVPAGKRAWDPDPALYNLKRADLLRSAKTLYRTHRNCDGTIRRNVHKRGLAIVDLQYGYQDYICQPLTPQAPDPGPPGIKTTISPSRPFGPPAEHENVSDLTATSYRVYEALGADLFSEQWLIR